jgi:hypothetical protein
MTLFVIGLFAAALVANVLFVKFVTSHAPVIPDGFGE